MSNERNYRNAVLLLAVAAMITIFLAVGTTLARVQTKVAENNPPGTMRLAKPRPPLDRSPGVALHNGN